MNADDFVDRHPIATGCLAVVICGLLFLLGVALIFTIYGAIFGSIGFGIYAAFKGLMAVFGL